MSCASLLFGQEFSPEEIAQTKAAHGLLTMEVEIGTACNFRCKYCYVGDVDSPESGKPKELTPDEIRDVIAQAQALGARKIILLGGEPMLYGFTPDLCAWIRGRGLGVEMFTNGTNLTADMAARLLQGTTVLMVTHDPAEAARLGDRILVMTPGGLAEHPAPPGPVPRRHDAAEVLAAQAALTERLLA